MKRSLIKTLSIFCAVALIFAALPLGVCLAEDVTPVLSLNGSAISGNNSAFTLKLDIQKNPGISAASFTVKYDKYTFETAAVTSSEFYQSSLNGLMVADHPEQGYISVVWCDETSEEEIKTNGTLISFDFKVKPSFTAGTYDLKIQNALPTIFGDDLYGALSNNNADAITPVANNSKCTLSGSDLTNIGISFASSHTHSYSDTWTQSSLAHWHECSVCGDKKDLANHSFEESVIPASADNDGQIITRCNVCGYEKSRTPINKIGDVTLSKTKFTENGTVQKPTVSVKDTNGLDIDSGSYTLTWSNENSSIAGTYTVTVNFFGNYSGQKILTYTIEENPVSEVMDFIGCSAYTKATLTLTWNKVDGAKGYRIYCTQLDKAYKVKGADITTYKVQNLKECKNYDFQICYYVNKGDGDIYSEYSQGFRYCTRPSPVNITSVENSSSGTVHSFTVAHTAVKNVSGYEVKYQLVGSKNYKTYNRTAETPKTIEVAKAGTYMVWTRAYKSAKYDGVNKFKANGDWSETYSTVVVK